MNFEISEEQGQLRDSVARLLAANYGFEQRRGIAASESGWSPEVWRQLCALGVTGLRIPEDCGGFGGSAADLQPVLQEFGKALLVEPFLASAVLGATALGRAGDAEIRKRLLPRVASGESVLAWAHDEPAARHAPLWVESTARQDAGQWRIDGHKFNVLHAAAAQQLVVTARTSGAPAERDGLALFLVDARASGLEMRAHRLVDDTPAAELRFDGVAAEPLGDPFDPSHGWPAIDATLKAGMAAVCADAVGAMEGAYALTISYLNTRRQFGRLLGENQALRHRVAEMMVSLESCRSMAMLAAATIDDPDAAETADLMRAKLVIGRHGRSLCQTAIQLHGGIGMTEEYAVGHCLRRIMVIDQLFGDSASQASRLAEMEFVHG
jgi:alkylation response protein AidB-like acyl-CoA dehydrogenase